MSSSNNVDIKAQAGGMKKELKSNERDLDREMRRLDLEERKLMSQIKQEAQKSGPANAKSNPMVKSYTKQLLQIRKQKEKMISMKSHIKSTSFQVQSMSTNMTMMNTMQSTTKIMGTMNNKMQVNMKNLELTKEEFARNQIAQEMFTETMDEMMDNLDGDDIEEEMNNEVSAVMQELALDKLVDVDVGSTALPSQGMKNQVESSVGNTVGDGSNSMTKEEKQVYDQIMLGA